MFLQIAANLIQICLNLIYLLLQFGNFILRCTLLFQKVDAARQLLDQSFQFCLQCFRSILKGLFCCSLNGFIPCRSILVDEINRLFQLINALQNLVNRATLGDQLVQFLNCSFQCVDGIFRSLHTIFQLGDSFGEIGDLGL